MKVPIDLVFSSNEFLGDFQKIKRISIENLLSTLL